MNDQKKPCPMCGTMRSCLNCQKRVECTPSPPPVDLRLRFADGAMLANFLSELEKWVDFEPLDGQHYLGEVFEVERFDQLPDSSDLRDNVEKYYAKARVYGAIANRFRQALEQIASGIGVTASHVAARDALKWRHSEKGGVPRTAIEEMNALLQREPLGQPVPWLGLPAGLPLSNGQPCDMLTGACSCGATHTLDELPARLRLGHPLDAKIIEAAEHHVNASSTTLAHGRASSSLVALEKAVRARRRATCEHLTQLETMPPRCADCGVTLVDAARDALARMNAQEPTTTARDRAWSDEVCAIAHELGVEYVADGHGSEPGSLPDLLARIRSLNEMARDNMPEWRDIRRVLKEKGWDWPGKPGLEYDSDKLALETERGRQLWKLVHGDRTSDAIHAEVLEAGLDDAGYHRVTLRCTPDECRRLAALVYSEVEIRPRSASASPKEKP